MLRNYFTIAIAILRRRKFFTFISLFGISFTLTILMVLTAFINRIINDTYPDRKRDRSLYMNNMTEKGPQIYNGGALSYYFLNHYVKKMKTPQKVAFSTRFEGTNTYVNNRKIAINFKYTDAEYWNVLEYDFVEGKPFSQQQVDNSERVAVISEDLKKNYFGDSGPVTGKYIEANNVSYRVTGVVKNIPITSYMFYADIYLPYTVSKSDFKEVGYRGDFMGIMLAPPGAGVSKMQKEYAALIRKLPMSDKQFNRIYSYAGTYIPAYLDTGDDERSGLLYALTAVIAFVLLCTLLPALNLVNINITRIMERSSEIGVRKAFGASSKTLVFQFLVENIILTLIGGVISVILSIMVISILNGSGLIANLDMKFNVPVMVIGLITCLFFGFLSGVYPAWRMSKLDVIKALKS